MNYEIVKLSDEIIDNKIDEKYLQQIFNCYRGLTDAPTLPFIKLRNIVLNLPDKHSIYVYKIDNKPVGLITLIIEQKLIHSGGLVGHIEDLCVDLLKKNFNVKIFDPLFKINQIFFEKTKLINQKPKKNFFDCIVLAVSHDKFKKYGLKNIKSWGKKDSKIIDIKGIFSNDTKN